MVAPLKWWNQLINTSNQRICPIACRLKREAQVEGKLPIQILLQASHTL